MLCLIPIGRGLLAGSLTVFAAAQRGLVLVGVIWLLERFAVPFIVAMAFPEVHTAPVAAPATDPTSGE
jgi:hypothetical protein